MPVDGNPFRSRAVRIIGWAAIVLAYVAALTWRHDVVPAGINNDAAEEAIRGLILVESRRFEPITMVVGNSAETLNPYLVAGVASLVGTRSLAIQIVSWGWAVALTILVVALVRRLDRTTPVILAFGAVASSVWLFHYARVGFRAIAAPVFLTALLLLMVDRTKRPIHAIAIGLVLGLGMYSYTSFRVVPVAWALWTAVMLMRSSPAVRRDTLRSAAWTVGSALLISVPNLGFMLQHPREFFLRGSYVVQGDVIGNLVATALIPFHYFDDYNSISGSHHFFDGASVSLTSAGISPVHPLIAILAIAGVVSLTRRNPAALRLLSCFVAVGLLVLGIAGPSLTRMLLLLPVVLVLAAAGLARIPRALAVLVIATVLTHHGYSYFVTYSHHAEAQSYFSPAATQIGNRAAELTRSGSRVLCIVAQDANVVRFLTWDVSDDVRIAEFYFTPYDRRRIPRDLHPDVVLIEKSDYLETAHQEFRVKSRLTDSEKFAEFDLRR